MNKIGFLILTGLILSACTTQHANLPPYTPWFKAGDCLVKEADVKCEREKESWEVCKHDRFYKVKQVGKKSYLITVYYPLENWSMDDTISFSWQDIYVKANCPAGW